jgi:hypothetical protein
MSIFGSVSMLDHEGNKHTAENRRKLFLSQVLSAADLPERVDQ